MSWHYLQGQEAASWEGACLDGAPSALLRLMPTAGTHSSHDSATDASNGSRYGTMPRPSMADRGAVQLTLCLEDSPAKTSARQAHARDWPEDVAASSLKCSGLLARSGLALCGRKTLRTCVPVASAPSSASLPAWGMMRDGECWELGTRVRRTSADECGFWPTPTTAGNELSPYMMRWPAHRRMARAFLPTPTAQRYGSNGPGRHWKEFLGSGKKRRGSLETIVGGIRLPLREWMMGWPIGWTALEPLEMGRFRRWLNLHGGC